MQISTLLTTSTGFSNLSRLGSTTMKFKMSISSRFLRRSLESWKSRTLKCQLRRISSVSQWIQSTSWKKKPRKIPRAPISSVEAQRPKINIKEFSISHNKITTAEFLKRKLRLLLKKKLWPLIVNCLRMIFMQSTTGQTMSLTRGKLPTPLTIVVKQLIFSVIMAVLMWMFFPQKTSTHSWGLTFSHRWSFYLKESYSKFTSIYLEQYCDQT